MEPSTGIPDPGDRDRVDTAAFVTCRLSRHAGSLVAVGGIRDIGSTITRKPDSHGFRVAMMWVNLVDGTGWRR